MSCSVCCRLILASASISLAVLPRRLLRLLANELAEEARDVDGVLPTLVVVADVGRLRAAACIALPSCGSRARVSSTMQCRDRKDNSLSGRRDPNGAARTVCSWAPAAAAAGCSLQRFSFLAPTRGLRVIIVYPGLL